jgi:uncharacterized protein (DUF2384 family)
MLPTAIAPRSRRRPSGTSNDQQRPIDLMTKPSGLELVEDYLGRVEYGVYT